MGIKKTKFRIIPNDNDGNFNVEIPLKTDSVYYNGNSFKVKLTDSEKTLEETININEDPNTVIEYSVSSSIDQISEDGAEMKFTVTADNVVAGNPPTRTLSISSSSPDDVSVSSELIIDSLSEEFSVSALSDSYVEPSEINTITISDDYSTFNGTADSIDLDLTIIDTTVPQYTLSVQDNVTEINENGGTVTFNISSNVLDGREVPFSIVETAGVDNIDSVTGDINGAGTHFLPDTSTGSASITVVTKLDAYIKEDNSFTFSSIEAGLSEIINITEQDTINYAVTPSPLTISEGSPAVTVDISASNVLNISSDRTLSISSDSDQVTLSSNSVTIPAGTYNLSDSIASASFTVTPVDDSSVELDEVITLTITDLESSNFTVNGSAGNTVEINLLDNDVPQYTLSVQDNVTEILKAGGSVTFNITSNVLDGRSVPFSIIQNSGSDFIDSVTGDINGAGTHFLPSTADGSASISITLKDDDGFVENQTFEFSSAESGLSETIDVIDNPRYTLSVQDNITTINEDGGTVTFQILTNHLFNINKQIGFSIHENSSSGLSANNILSVQGVGVQWDAETNTGYFTTNTAGADSEGNELITVTTQTDNIIWEDNYFSFKMQESGAEYKKDQNPTIYTNYVEKQIQIIEQTPENFTVSYNSSETGYSEGDTLVFNFASDKNIVSAKDLSYSIDIMDPTYGEISLGDFSPLEESGTFKSDSSLILTITSDLIIENAEYLKITFSDPSNSSSTFSSNDIVIKINQNDQGELPLSGASISDALYHVFNSGAVTSSRTSLNEDEYIVFEIDTKNIGDGRWLDYNISCDGDNSFTVDSRWWKQMDNMNDFHSILSENHISYSDNIQPDSNPATGKIKPLADGFAYLFIDLSSGTDAGINDKTLTLTITDLDSNQSISSNPITLVDTSSESFTVETLKNGASFNHLTENLSEGDTLTVNITPSNWVNSSRGITYTLSESLEDSDITPSTTPVNLTLDSNTFSFTLNVTDDILIENLENFTITLSDNYSSTFDKNDMSINVSASDTSETPNYNITSDIESISEKSGVVEFTITSNVGDTRYVYYDVTASSGISSISGISGTDVDSVNQKIRMKNDGSATISITLDEFTDSSFESGSLTLTLLNSPSGSVLSEKTIAISDSSPFQYTTSAKYYYGVDAAGATGNTVNLNQVVSLYEPSVGNLSDSTSIQNSTFDSDISGWTTVSEMDQQADVIHDTSYDGTMRFASTLGKFANAEATITHTNSGTQTNRIRINIPHISSNNSQMYVEIFKDGVSLYNSGYQYLRDTISSDFGVITANGDGTYSGYVEVEYIDDVDLNSEYKLKIGHDQISAEGNWDYTYVGDIQIYDKENSRIIFDFEVQNSGSSDLTAISRQITATITYDYDSTSVAEQSDISFNSPFEILNDNSMSSTEMKGQFILDITSDLIIENAEYLKITFSDPLNSSSIFSSNDIVIKINQNDQGEIPLSGASISDAYYNTKIDGTSTILTRTSLNEDEYIVFKIDTKNIGDGRWLDYNISCDGDNSFTVDSRWWKAAYLEDILHPQNISYSDNIQPDSNPATGKIKPLENGIAYLFIDLSSGTDTGINDKTLTLTITDPDSNQSISSNPITLFDTSTESFAVTTLKNGVSFNHLTENLSEGDILSVVVSPSNNWVNSSREIKYIINKDSIIDDDITPSTTPVNLTLDSNTFSFTLNVTDDLLIENNEFFEIILSDDYGSTFDKNDMRINVSASDTSETPNYTITSNTTTLQENGGTVDFTITSNAGDERELDFEIIENGTSNNIKRISGLSSTIVSYSVSQRTGKVKIKEDGTCNFRITSKTDNHIWNTDNYFKIKFLETGSIFNTYNDSVEIDITVTDDMSPFTYDIYPYISDSEGNYDISSNNLTEASSMMFSVVPFVNEGFSRDIFYKIDKLTTTNDFNYETAKIDVSVDGNGTVTSITIVEGGFGYTSGNVGLEEIFGIGNGDFTVNLTDSSITSITIVDGGTGHLSRTNTDVYHKFNLTHSGYNLMVSTVDDTFVEPDEEFKIYFKDLSSSDNPSRSSFVINGLSNLFFIESSTTVNSLNSTAPEYTVSSNVNTVDEDGGIVVLDISSNVRRGGQSIGFEITETAGVNNIESVSQAHYGSTESTGTVEHFYDDFSSDISGWPTASRGNNPDASVTHSTLYDGTMKFEAINQSGDWAYAETPITHFNSGNQTNRIRINIPHITNNNSRMYVQIYKNDTLLYDSGWQNLLDTISSDYGVINANGDGTYSGYLEVDYTDDVDLNSTYKIRIGHEQINWWSIDAYTYIGDVSIYVPTQGNQGKSGTITPSEIDGSSRLFVKMKTDSVIYDENTFDITFSETGSEFKLDTDSDFTPNQVTKTINISEFSPVDYKVTSDVIQTTESGSAINVTIEATNLSDIINVSRTLNLSTDNPKVSIPSTVGITTISAGEHSGSFIITPLEDSLVYPDEVNITITDTQSSSSTFLVNPDSENEAPVVGTGTLTVTVIDNDVPEYTVSSNVNTVDEDGGIVVFDISSNARGTSLPFEITETAGVNNIESVYQKFFDEFFYDDFESDISGWTTTESSYSSVTHSTLYDGTMKFCSIDGVYASSGTYINHTNSGTQTNRVRINIPHISDNNSEMYVEIRKVGTSYYPYNSGWIRLNGSSSSDIDFITANGDGTYSGYLEVEYTHDVDLNSEYKLTISYNQINNSETKVYTYIGDIGIYGPSQNLGKSGTITPSAIDGSSKLVVTMKTDSVVSDGPFDITFSESGSEFKLDTDSDFTPNQVTKTINISEFSPVDYKVTSDVIQTTESGSAINVTIEATNLSDIINVSRTLNLSTNHGGVSIPSTVDITTISAGEHSGSFTITPLEDSLVYPDEVNITITDPVNSSSTFLVNPDSENEAPVVGTGTLTVTVIDNDVPEYTVSSNVNTVDEDGGIVVFDISSNVRRDDQSIGFEITETAGVNNIESVYQLYLYDDFQSDISGWTTAVQNYANVTHSTLYDGTMMFESRYSDWAYAETPITHFNSGNQTNRIRINIPHISSNNSQMYVEIFKDGVSLYNSGYQYLRDTISSDYGVINANGDGTYSGYLEVDYTDDVDLNSEYKLRIGHDQINWASNPAYTYIGDINIYEPSQNLGNLATITPSAIDGSSKLVVTMKTDSVVSDENTFDITFSESESEFKLDTDSDFTLNQVTKTIDINEFSPVDYKVTSDVIQTTEGGSAINVTIEARNLSDIINVSRTLNLSTDNPKVSIPSTVGITTISAGEHSGSFIITPLEDSSLVYPNEVNITITDPQNSSSTFLVNPDSENEAPVVGTGTLTVTVIDNEVPEYTVSSNVNTVDEDGGVVVFDISSNARGTSLPFEITETAGVNNIESVYQSYLYDDFQSDISGWTTAVQFWNYANVTHSTLYDGTIRFGSFRERWSYAETSITHANSGTQTNRIRINIPHITSNNSKMYVEIFKDGVSLYNSGYKYLRDTISSDFGVITANGDGTYSGYLEVDYTDDVDLNSEYKLRIGHDQIDYSSTWAYVYIGDINIYNLSQGDLGKSGTITPSEIDGSSRLVVTMKTDSTSTPGNTFDITFSETGSEFKLDTDSDFTSDSVTKTININEQG